MGGLDRHEVDRERVTRLCSLDVERSRLRIDERELDDAADEVLGAADLSAERVLGPELEDVAAFTFITGAAPPNVHTNADGSGR